MGFSNRLGSLTVAVTGSVSSVPVSTAQGIQRLETRTTNSAPSKKPGGFGVSNSALAQAVPKVDSTAKSLMPSKKPDL
jgi:hypothetical protein